MKTILFAGAAIFCASLAAVPARASIIVTLENTTAANGGMDYTYAVTLSQDEQLNNSVQQAFFDIYNFGAASLVSETGDMNSGSWAFSNVIVPSSSYAEGTTPADNKNTLDIRFVYSGPVVTGPSLGTADGNLGTFTVFTTYTGSYSVHNNVQDAQLVKFAPGQVSNNTPTSNLAAAATPDAPAAVPEPASLAMLAGSLVAGGIFAGRSRGARRGAVA
jgi:hypothetical protein